MPMLIILLVVSPFMYFMFYKKFKTHASQQTHAMARTIIWIVLSFAISNLVAFNLFPKDYTLVEGLKIRPMTIKGIKSEKYIIRRNALPVEFFAEDGDKKLKRYGLIEEKKLNIVEQKREDGIVKIYKSSSKTFKFFSVFRPTKYETFIPVGGILDLDQ